jgi:PKD repeat protein
VSNADHHYESLRTPVTIAVKPVPKINAPPNVAFCEGQSVELSATQGDEYTWSNGLKTQTIDVSTSGIYSVAVLSGSLSCTSRPVTVTVNAAPVAAFTATPDIISTTEEIFFSNQTTGATLWEWDFGDGSGSIEQNPSHQYTEMGAYTVTLKATSDFGCIDTESKLIGIVTGTEPSLAKTTLLFPNPIYDGTLFLKHVVSREPIELEIFNIQGKLVLRKTMELHETQTSLDVSSLANGVYQVQIRAREELITRKIVVVR